MTLGLDLFSGAYL